MIINCWKIQIRAILLYLWKERAQWKDKAKEMNDEEGPGTVNERVTQNWFRRFKKGDTSLEDKPRSGRYPIVEDVALLEMVDQ